MQIITITDDWYEELSRALILMRDNSKITKTNLAIECGYSQQTLSGIERGRLSMMNCKFWDTLARALHYRLEIRFVPSSYLGPRIAEKVEALQKQNLGIWDRAQVSSFYPDIEPDHAEKIAEILNTAESSETQLAEATAFEVEVENECLRKGTGGNFTGFVDSRCHPKSGLHKKRVRVRKKSIKKAKSSKRNR